MHVSLQIAHIITQRDSLACVKSGTFVQRGSRERQRFPQKITITRLGEGSRHAIARAITQVACLCQSESGLVLPDSPTIIARQRHCEIAANDAASRGDSRRVIRC